MAAAEYAECGILVSRNRESRRGNSRPSIISIVTKALARNHINLDETTIQKLWFGLPGELVRESLIEMSVSQRMREFVGS